MEQRTRIKICGITQPQDGQVAATAGVDAIGLVFYPPSPRAVVPDQARTIIAALPPFTTVVGLFVDPDPAYVTAVLATVPLDVIQFHGDEPPLFCSSFNRPYIKAVAMGPDLDLAGYGQRYQGAQGILVDTYRPGIPGGTGECFNWDWLPQTRDFPLILAGGLTPTNVMEALRRVRPYAVDVSSGVELAKGIKDSGRIASLVKAVAQGDGWSNGNQ